MYNKNRVATAAALLFTGTAWAQTPALDRDVMQMQVVLDRLGFSPGAVDGKRGQSLVRALRGFQMAQGITVSGTVDQATKQALESYKSVPPTVSVQLGANDVAGPFVNPTPKDAADQAKLNCLCYRTVLEKLSERFHTTPATLVALNSPDTPLKAGQAIVVPAVLPETRDYSAIKDEAWRATLVEHYGEAFSIAECRSEAAAGGPDRRR